MKPGECIINSAAILYSLINCLRNLISSSDFNHLHQNGKSFNVLLLTDSFTLNKLFVMKKYRIPAILIFLLSLSATNVQSQTRKFPTPPSADTIKNPVKADDYSIAAGKTFYTRFCVTCHGEKGKGDGVASAGLAKPPADHTSTFVQNQTDGALFWIISMGNSPMPFYRKTLTETQRWQIVNYMRTLKKIK
jgi:mono/diheme cytochrome c family protein